MKPILLPVELPPGITLHIKQKPGYATYWLIYIRGHWLRSWFGYSVGSCHNTKQACETFILEYYGCIATTDTVTYPEHFL